MQLFEKKPKLDIRSCLRLLITTRQQPISQQGVTKFPLRCAKKLAETVSCMWK